MEPPLEDVKDHSHNLSMLMFNGDYYFLFFLYLYGGSGFSLDLNDLKICS